MACQGDSEPSLGCDHWWSNHGPIVTQSWSNHAKAMGSLPLVATKKKKKKHIELSWFLYSLSPRERPHPRSAEGPTITPATPTGEPRERPQSGLAEVPKQPMLQLRPPAPREWPCQVGLADVNLDLADDRIDPAEVLPRRVQKLLGPHTSAASMPASGGASLLELVPDRVPDSRS